MNDVVKAITVTNDTMLVSLAVVSKIWLDKLPPDLRKIVLDTGLSTQGRRTQWEKDFTKGLDKVWADMGGQIHTLPPDDLKKMAELLNSVGDDVTKDQPAVNEMLKRVRAVVVRRHGAGSGQEFLQVPEPGDLDVGEAPQFLDQPLDRVVVGESLADR